MKTLIKRSNFWSHLLCVFSMKDIHCCFMTRSQVQVTVSNAETTLWFLKIIKTPSNLNHPSIVESVLKMHNKKVTSTWCTSSLFQSQFFQSQLVPSITNTCVNHRRHHSVERYYISNTNNIFTIRKYRTTEGWFHPVRATASYFVSHSKLGLNSLTSNNCHLVIFLYHLPDFSIMYGRRKFNTQCYSIITQWLFYSFQGNPLFTPTTLSKVKITWWGVVFFFKLYILLLVTTS